MVNDILLKKNTCTHVYVTFNCINKMFHQLITFNFINIYKFHDRTIHSFMLNMYTKVHVNHMLCTIKYLNFVVCVCITSKIYKPKIMIIFYMSNICGYFSSTEGMGGKLNPTMSLSK